MVKTLYEHLIHWTDQNLLTREQQNKGQEYLRKMEISISDHTNNFYRKIIKVCYVLSTLLILSGILYFVASNWKGFSKFEKVSILSGSLFITYLTAIISEFHKQEKLFRNNILYFSGTILFGINLALLGQIYNTHASDYLLFFFWLLPSICFALLTGFEAFYSLSCILLNLTIWFYLFPSSLNLFPFFYKTPLGHFTAILINSALFYYSWFKRQKKPGFRSTVLIPYLAAFSHLYLISFYFQSLDYVIPCNIMMILFMVHTVYLFSKSLIYSEFLITSIVVSSVYLFSKYFEIIAYHCRSTEDYLIIIFFGLVITFVNGKIALKISRKSKPEKESEND